MAAEGELRAELLNNPAWLRGVLWLAAAQAGGELHLDLTEAVKLAAIDPQEIGLLEYAYSEDWATLVVRTRKKEST